MKTILTIFAVIAVLAILIVPSVTLGPWKARAMELAAEDTPEYTATDFVLRDFEGIEYRLSAITREQPVLLVFADSDGKTLEQQATDIQRLAAKYGDKIAVLTVTEPAFASEMAAFCGAGTGETALGKPYSIDGCGIVTTLVDEPENSIAAAYDTEDDSAYFIGINGTIVVSQESFDANKIEQAIIEYFWQD